MALYLDPLALTIILAISNVLFIAITRSNKTIRSIQMQSKTRHKLICRHHDLIVAFSITWTPIAYWLMAESRVCRIEYQSWTGVILTA
jgi:uncharacterized membrane protein